jgi:ABC-type sugar transport system substrate-binding protein
VRLKPLGHPSIGGAYGAAGIPMQGAVGYQLAAAMLRLIARLLGLAALAAAMAAGVHDGAKSIADGVVHATSLQDLGLRAWPRAFADLGTTIGRGLHPFLWDPVLVTLLRLPAALALFGLGLVLLSLGQRPVAPIVAPD